MNDTSRVRRSLLLVLAIALPLLALRLFTPYELQETDQGKQAQYALDVVQNGHWLAPGCLGVAATKPPLYSWLAALVSIVAGRIDELTIRVPTVLSALALVLVTWDVARRLAGVRVATVAAIAVATSHHFIQLSGVVRTDGLLSALLAAQVLVYVRSIGEERMPAGGVAASSVLAMAACLAKGPAGLLSSAVVAAHLWATGRPRRAWMSAGVPAAAGLAALAAWFLAAGQTRQDLYDTMVSREIARHATAEGLPNPFYYLLHAPFRLGAWALLLVPAALLARDALRHRGERPVPPLVSLALAWIAVHLVAYSFLPHQRPDLIYPAEPAVLLLVAALVEVPFPRWAPGAVAACVAGAAILVLVPVRALPEDPPLYLLPMTAAFLVGAAAVTLRIARLDTAVACVFGLAAIGVADDLLDTMGDAPREERASYRSFAATAHAEAARRSAALVAIGIDKPAPLFDLRICASAFGAGKSLGASATPVLVVTVPTKLSFVEKTLGPCEVVTEHVSADPSRATLLLVAPR